MTKANDNRFCLYRIRRKADGLYLEWNPSPTPGDHETAFGPNGIFWKKPATVRKHLLELCQFRLYCFEEDKVWNYNMRNRSRRGHRQLRSDEKSNNHFALVSHDAQQRLVKTVYEWLDLYEVVVTVVDEHSTKTTPAAEFANFTGRQLNEILEATA